MLRPENFRFAGFLLLGLLFGRLPAPGSPFSLKLCSGASWIDGGDLNRTIRGWKDYSQNRRSSGFDISFGLKELRLMGDFQAELSYRLSSRWSLALASGYVFGTTSGEISTRLSGKESYTISSTQGGSISIQEETDELPRYELTAVPALLTLLRTFPLGGHIDLSLGAGGGLYFGRYTYREEYTYRLDYSDTQYFPGGSIQEVDRYTSKGKLRQQAADAGFGLHGLVGLEWKIGSSISLVLEVVGRWAALGDWRGEKKDSSQWSHTWGIAAAFSESGRVDEMSEGKLWRVAAFEETASASYPRLLLSESAPVSSSYADVRPARISLGGVTARIGMKLQLGEKE